MDGEKLCRNGRKEWRDRVRGWRSRGLDNRIKGDMKRECKD